MNTILLNTIILNGVRLNRIGSKKRKGEPGGGGGGGDIPTGYDVFLAADGDFLTSNGEEIYVKS